MKNTKKILAVVMALVMTIGLVACDNNDKTPNTTTSPTTENTTPHADVTETPDVTEAPDATDNTEYEDGAEDVVMSETSVLLTQLQENCPVDIMTGVQMINHDDTEILASFTGLNDNTGIVEASALESMIGSQAYSVVLVKLDGSVDAQKIADDIKANVNPAKWICVEADDVKTAVVGDYVLLAMMNSNFSTAQAHIDAFTAMMNDVTVDVAPSVDATEDAGNAG